MAEPKKEEKKNPIWLFCRSKKQFNANPSGIISPLWNDCSASVYIFYSADLFLATPKMRSIYNVSECFRQIKSHMIMLMFACNKYRRSKSSYRTTGESHLFAYFRASKLVYYEHTACKWIRGKIAFSKYFTLGNCITNRNEMQQ